ncbi:hypothetical protein X474_12665 [Dethiosulfatarculus sandiegensis]|uniref:Uncharacterized protein n=1 Tax=Dethiosulfatarculus sandiegensis TaxID=1429043 RepID=A0A0D2J717_9BACT|nr:hypothetical protein X474_12665 [Dethiosulfatarculus sandiegensis]
MGGKTFAMERITHRSHEAYAQDLTGHRLKRQRCVGWEHLFLVTWELSAQEDKILHAANQRQNRELHSAQHQGVSLQPSL